MKHPIVYINRKDHQVYAYTTDKKLARKFEKIRDMSMFRKIRIDKDDLKHLREKNGFSLTRLMEYDLSTYTYERGYFEVPMVITLDEKVRILGVGDLYGRDQHLWAGSWVSPKIYKTDIVKCLDTLGYIDRFDELYDMLNYGSTISFELPADELKRFIHFFGDTLKEDNEDENL